MVDHDVEIRDGIGIVVYRGEFGLRGFSAALERLLALPGFVPGMPCLWDTRQATINVDRWDISKIGWIMSQQAELRGKGKTAVVVGSDLGFGMARMYELATENDDRNPFRVFRDETKARAWLLSDAE